MSDCVEYQSLMDYLNVTNKFNRDTRYIMSRLIHVLMLKGILNNDEVEYIRGCADEQSNNTRN